MRRVQDFLGNERLDTICYLDRELMVKASDDEQLKSAICEMDLLIPGNVDILRAGGVKSKSREKEVEGNFFLREILKKLAREKKRVFIVADTQDDLVRLREQLLLIEGRLTFFGSFAYDDLAGTDDAIINEINSVVPDVILSQISNASQEVLMSKSKLMANATLWLALQPSSLATPIVKKQRFPNQMLSFIDRVIFKRAVNQFEDKQP